MNNLAQLTGNIKAEIDLLMSKAIGLFVFVMSTIDGIKTNLAKSWIKRSTLSE